MRRVDAVTGAFGYSGARIAVRLLHAGRDVRTLTASPAPAHPLWGRVEVHPLAFDDPARLRRALEGADVLYNTYWVRFQAAGFSQDRAVTNTETLFEAARAAGVRRVVHTSITNPAADSPYRYFRGKARLEAALSASGLRYAILRPAVFFGSSCGRGDVLLNNTAWVLRRFPVFGCFGRGTYRVRAVHVDDFAALATEWGGRDEDALVDAVGPETWTWRDLVRMLGDAIGCPRPVVGVPRSLGRLVAAAVGRLKGDVMLTREEIDALMDDLLVTEGPATGRTRLSAWARAHAATLGRTYASELGRRRRDGAPRGHEVPGPVPAV